MAYDLAVPYAILKDGRKESYLYCDNEYRTKWQMWEEILKKHLTINSSNIILFNIGTHIKRGPFQKAPQDIYENPLQNFAIKRQTPIIIKEYCNRLGFYYSCLERMFIDYNMALGYARLMTLKVKYTYKLKVHPKVPRELNILKKVECNSFSNRIWHIVWKNCFYYRCFAAHDFMEFKLRLLTELNYYRLRHNANPVKFRKLTTMVAEGYLQRILNTGLKFTDQKVLQYYESSPYYFAPLFLKKWYDERKYYKYGTNLAITGTEHFTAMVWKSVKHVGIAVKEVNNIIHMYIVFQPTPNGLNLFSSNIERKKFSFRI
uniref:SCP domain-containing protein n=1 Tax=Strongyloides venezuelensis TaxID=75913 RepID=A0A0K0G219_STRVS